MPLSGDRHRILRHRLQEGALRLGSRAVDLVGKHDLPEDGSLLHREHRSGRTLRRVHHEDVCAHDVAWHQVGRELNAREPQVEALRESADKQRLAQARRPLQKDVAPGGERPHDLVDDFALSDDNAADGVAQLSGGLSRMDKP